MICDRQAIWTIKRNRATTGRQRASGRPRAHDHEHRAARDLRGAGRHRRLALERHARRAPRRRMHFVGSPQLQSDRGPAAVGASLVDRSPRTRAAPIIHSDDATAPCADPASPASIRSVDMRDSVMLGQMAAFADACCGTNRVHAAETPGAPPSAGRLTRLRAVGRGREPDDLTTRAGQDRHRCPPDQRSDRRHAACHRLCAMGFRWRPAASTTPACAGIGAASMSAPMPSSRQSDPRDGPARERVRAPAANARPGARSFRPVEGQAATLAPLVGL